MEEPIARRVGALLSSRLTRASLWLSTGALLTGLLHYVFQVIMGRMLDTETYGVFAAIMALFAFLAAPLGALLMIVSRRVSEYRAAGDARGIAHFYASINLRAAAAGAALVALLLVFASSVQAYLKAASAVPVYMLGALLFLSLPPIVNNAFLQGLQRFGWLSASGAVAAAIKIALGAALVALGFGVSGAVLGVVLTAAITWVMTYAALRPAISGATAGPNRPPQLSLRAAVPVLAATAAFAAMTQLDMVVVNYYFPPREAGLYAAASVLSKAVLYLPGGIAMALFPMVAENDARDTASADLFLQAVVLTLAMCVAGGVFFFAFAEPIITLFYGPGYREAAAILKYFGFAILPMALVLVAEHFLIAKGRVLFAYLFVFVAPLQLGAIYLWHGSLSTVLLIVGISGLALATTGYGLLWRAFGRSGKA